MRKRVFTIWVNQDLKCFKGFLLHNTLAAVDNVGHTSHTHFMSHSSDSNIPALFCLLQKKTPPSLDYCEEALFRTDLWWPFREAFNPATIISSQELFLRDKKKKKKETPKQSQCLDGPLRHG